MTTWYRTSQTGRNIEAVEVERESTDFIWINGDRTAKKVRCERYFPTWEEAAEFALKRSEVHIQTLQLDLNVALGAQAALLRQMEDRQRKRLADAQSFAESLPENGD